MKTRKWADLDSIERQRLARDLVNEHVLCNLTALVDYILQCDDSDAPLTRDDFTNIWGCAPDDDEEAITLALEEGWDPKAEDYDPPFPEDPGEWPHYEGLDTVADDARDYLSVDMRPPEVFHWYAVSDWLANRLLEKGEVILCEDWHVSIWGRQTTGQATYIDYVIEAITAADHDKEGAK